MTATRGPLAAKPIPAEELTEKRLANYWKKVVKTPGCWVWTGGTTGHGTHPYGMMRLGALNYPAHRIAYYLHHGENVPEGYVIDHTCKVTRCVNPEHLEVVTQAENLSRGARWAS